MPLTGLRRLALFQPREGRLSGDCAREGRAREERGEVILGLIPIPDRRSEAVLPLVTLERRLDHAEHGEPRKTPRSLIIRLAGVA